MRSKRITVLACALLLGAAPALAQDEAPTAQEIQQKVQQAINALPREERNQQNVQRVVSEALADVDFSALEVQQLRVIPIWYASPELAEKIKARLDELKARNDAQGAAAWAMSIEQQRGDSEAFKEAFINTANHPALGEALQQGMAAEVFNAVGAIPEELRAELSEEVVSLADQLESGLPPRTLTSAVGYFTGVMEMGDAIDPAVREDIRESLGKVVAHAAANSEEESLTKYLNDSVKFLEGAYARGELLNHEAPDITITWYSGDEEVKSFDDLKGKVVVVDFWATWCGPCIASFPNIRELQERYNGYDVAIVGITSLQGKHYPGKGAPAVETEGDPQKEYDLMKEFMQAEHNNITWLVAFTEENVFNPDFGVRGIPHMAIIDAEGVVRYRGMHPAASSLAEKAEKIDALLKEANLPAPPPLATGTPEVDD